MKRRPAWIKVTVQHYRGEVARTTELYRDCPEDEATVILLRKGAWSIPLRLLVGEGEYGDSD